MRFERIHAENYCSYKTFDLNLDGLGRIFSVSGHNGAGKTTMFKALAVLLYEQTPSEGRGIGKYVRNVPSWGNKDALEKMRKKKELPVLRMEGYLVHAGHRYRITRTFDPNLKQGNHALSLQRKPADQDPTSWGESDGVQVLNGQTIADTQDLIERQFGNYRSFITSTFMSHGVSFFLDASDDDREDVAAYIFGCDGYDRRLQAASAKRLDIERMIDAKTAAVPDLLKKAGTRETLRTDLDQIAQAISAADRAIAEHGHSQTLRDHEMRGIIEATADKAQAVRAGIEARERIDALTRQADDLRALLASQDELRDQSQSLRDARAVIRDQQDRYTKDSQAQREIARLTQAIDGEKARLESMTAQLQARAKALASVDPDAATAVIMGIDTRLQGLAGTDAALADARKKAESLAADRASATAEIGRLTSRQREITENIGIITGAAGCCPTCERAFASDSERADLVDRFRHESVVVSEKVAELSCDMDAIDTATKAARAAISALELGVREQQTLMADRARAEHQAEEAARSLADRQQVEAQIQQYQQSLAAGTYATDVRAELARVQQLLAEIGFNQQAYTAATQTERALAGIEAAIARMEKADDELREIGKQVEVAQATATAGAAAQAEMALLVARRAEVEKMLGEIAESRAGLDRHRAELLGHQMVADTALAEAEKAALDVQAITESIGDQRKQVAVLKVLEAAFKPQGIPAMKYSRYLPTLNNKVNYALGILAPGWQIHITSSISSRGKFTIPIESIDPDGIVKAYASRSNGEKFILALAFLIGMGLFWAERTGAQPQHILIDEGFGALDPQNLEKAKAAIAAAATNFGQVGIISHLPDLNSIGQVQLHVYKDGAEGSKFEIQGVGAAPTRVRKHFMFAPDQWGAIATGLGVMKEALPGISDERAIEAAVVTTAQGCAVKRRRNKKSA